MKKLISGTYEELIEINGHFAHLIQQQQCQKHSCNDLQNISKESHFKSSSPRTPKNQEVDKFYENREVTNPNMTRDSQRSTTDIIPLSPPINRLQRMNQSIASTKAPPIDLLDQGTAVPGSNHKQHSSSFSNNPFPPQTPWIWSVRWPCANRVQSRHRPLFLS